MNIYGCNLLLCIDDNCSFSPTYVGFIWKVSMDLNPGSITRFVLNAFL